MNIYKFKPGPAGYTDGLYFEAADFKEAISKVPKLIDLFEPLEREFIENLKKDLEQKKKVWAERLAAKEVKPDDKKPYSDYIPSVFSLEKTSSSIEVTFFAKKQDV